VCWNVLLSELSLSHDRGSEDGIGGRDSSGDDEGGKELEAGDDGVHEGGGDHPTEEHAAIWEKRYAMSVLLRRAEGEGSASARTWDRVACIAISSVVRRRLCDYPEASSQFVSKCERHLRSANALGQLDSDGENRESNHDPREFEGDIVERVTCGSQRSASVRTAVVATFPPQAPTVTHRQTRTSVRRYQQHILCDGVMGIGSALDPLLQSSLHLVATTEQPSRQFRKLDSRESNTETCSDDGLSYEKPFLDETPAKQSTKRGRSAFAGEAEMKASDGL